MRRVRAGWPFDLLDVIAFLGLCILAYGCYLVHPAVAWIVTGVLLLLYAFAAARAVPPTP